MLKALRHILVHVAALLHTRGHAHLQNLVNLLLKIHVQQFVRLVKHQVLEPFEAEALQAHHKMKTVSVLQQAAARGTGAAVQERRSAAYA